ncbi:MAG TPA: xanthine dehydrogenase family protein molybdopterin-binding subunit [Acidimicrobiia bacterium]|nr:xanthine dehydrogenase family protein molybdopterin-binding subunit [Acidimicrobiia bacterium]
MRFVGEGIRRREDPALITGRSRFIADLSHECDAVAFVRSPVAAGHIRGVEAPDDARVFTAAHLGDMGSVVPMLHRPDYVPVAQPLLATDQVKYVGEPVAMVVADSRHSAEDLAEQVFLDIEPIDEVSSASAALVDGAPRVHHGTDSNVVVSGNIDTGDVDRAFRSAAQVIGIEVTSGRQSAMPLEARGAVAIKDAASERITLYASTQMPHVLRTIVADLLRIPESDLHVIAPSVGGAFGQKMALPTEYALVVWLARRLGQSVCWIEDRRENFTSSFHARDHQYRLEAAFDGEARLIAVDADLVANVGAYSCYPVTWGVEPLMAAAELPGPYDFQSYRVRARGVTTNTCPMSPYRGVSRPVLTLAMERLMDTAAERFGIDPIEIRRRNLITSFPYRSATGVVYDEGSYLQSLERAAEVIDMEAFRRTQEEARKQGRYPGVGFSVFSERTGYGTPTFAQRSMEVTPGYETVDMIMDPSGNVEVRIGASPHGQGLVTSLSQLVADELGVHPETVQVVHGDTDRTPYGWGTFASRSMVISGGASHLAAGKLRDSIVEIAGDILEAAPVDIVLTDGKAVVRGTDKGVSIPEVARVAHHQSHRLKPGRDPGLRAVATYDPAGTFSNACHVAVVEVDIETGGVRLERFVVVEDAGLLINPVIVDGQIAGGVAQGIANALFEEIIYDESGNILTTSLLDYLPPTMSEIPRIEIHHLETITDASITGAKGLGEGGAIGAPAAVINAVSDALRPLGVGITEIPATPSRVRDWIRIALEGAA